MTGLLLALALQALPAGEFSCDGFSVVVTSASGEPNNDDERVEVVLEGARFVVPLRPAQFTFSGEWASSRPNPAQRCRAGLVAWAVGPNQVLLMFSRSGRPGLDLASFALVDLAQRKTLAVLDTQLALASARAEGPGGTSFSFITRAAPQGFDVRLVREWLPGDDSPVGALEDWFAVRVKKGALKAGWLRP
jgi:hypothetical protein